MTRAFVLGCAFVLVAGAAAQAQEAVPESQLREARAGPVRGRGFLIGYSIGMGHVASDPCGDCWYRPRSVLDLSHAIHVGWMVGGRLAVMVEAAGVGTDTADHSLVALAAQWWPSAMGRSWVKGGIGVGSYVLGDTSNAGSAPTYATVLGEGGLEVIRHRRFTTDLQIRGAATKRPDRWGTSVSGSVGFNWYQGWR